MVKRVEEVLRHRDELIVDSVYSYFAENEAGGHRHPDP